MTSKWVNSRHVRGSGPYYVRGVRFVDGVAEDGPEVNAGVAEFFQTVGIHLEETKEGPTEPSEESPAPETPEEPEKAEEGVETAQEDIPVAKPPTTRTRKK